MRKMVEEKPELGQEMIEGALNAILGGDLEEGRLLLRSYINATISFAELGRRLEKDPKNLMRSLGPKGNPTAANLFEMIRACTEAGDLEVTARVAPRQPAPAPG
jgi:hypothetical protein